MMNQQYQILIKKLDEFIRKYYKNRLIKGIIYAVAVFLVFFLAMVLLEHFAYFNTKVRTLLFYSYIVLTAIIFVWLILIPVLKLIRIGKIISHKRAAQIIGTHFKEVKDTLLNTLQLKTIAETDKNNDLIEASINQRIEKLKPIPFKMAIDFKNNRKYLKYALPPLLILLLILLISPTTITKPTERIVQHNKEFKREAPFAFFLENKKMECIQKEDFTVSVKVQGKAIPDMVFIETANSRFRMKQKDKLTFEHTFYQVQQDVSFKLTAAKVVSSEYQIKMLPKPTIINFDVFLNYPNYTGKKNESLNNNADLIVPEGTSVSWKFYTRDVKLLNLFFRDDEQEIESKNSNTFSFTKYIKTNQEFAVGVSNENLQNPDSLWLSATVIKDEYPSIEVSEQRDSAFRKRIFFNGSITDDYGFKELNFVYRKIGMGESKGARYIPVEINKDISQQQFFYYADIDSLEIKQGDQIEYYFEIWDNDAVNGSKKSRSKSMTYRLPTESELIEETDKKRGEFKDEMKKSQEEAKELQKDLEKFQKQLLQKKQINWSDKKQAEDLLKRQDNLHQSIENMQEELQKDMMRMEQFKRPSDELMKKYDEMQKLFDKIIPEEMKKMMEELQKLMEEMDKDKMKEMMEKMQLNDKDLEEQLDRNIELFKQLEFEQKMEETIEKLEKLAEEQEKLSEETTKSKDKEYIKEKQKKINEEFKSLEKELEKLQKMNEELEDPNNLPDTKQEQQEIEEDLQESMENMEKNKSNKASKSQKSASEKMKKMAQKMSDMMAQMQKDSLGEDIDLLRDILENLIQLSFDEEELKENTKIISLNDPKYTELGRKQLKISNDLEIVKDSLLALGKRQTRIQPFITREINEINHNIEKTIDLLEARKPKNAAVKQQYTMTSLNNLALLLSEILINMQSDFNKQCNKGSKGGGSCSKPGSGGKKSMKSMKQMQQQLNKQLQQFKDGIKPGQKPGGQSMSEQLVRMSAQQQLIRNELQNYMEQLKKEGQNPGGDLKKAVEEMGKTETDIVNKMINQATIQRQQQILTRLLKSEKAEQKREKEKKREAKEAKTQKYSNHKDVFKYNRNKNNEIELIKNIPPSLKPYYKQKAVEYFYNFENGESKTPENSPKN